MEFNVFSSWDPRHYYLGKTEHAAEKRGPVKVVIRSI